MTILQIFELTLITTNVIIQIYSLITAFDKHEIRSKCVRAYCGVKIILYTTKLRCIQRVNSLSSTRMIIFDYRTICLWCEKNESWIRQELG